MAVTPTDTVLIRVDATPAMGTGHVMRCLAVAEALAELGHGCRFAAAAITDALAARLEAAGFPAVRLETEPGSALDLAATLDLASFSAGVVLDGYHFGETYRASLAAAGKPVLAFDDVATLSFLHASIVANPGPAAAGMPYGRIAPGAELLLGPAYAPLRREFRAALAAPLPPLSERRSVLLTFGGSDPAGLTVPVVKRLAPLLPDDTVLEVVVGGSNPRLDCIEAAVDRFPGRARLHVETPGMAMLMLGAGLAVSAAGGTLGELAALRVPTLLVVVADNQIPSAQVAEAEGACVMVDGRAADTPDRIADAALDLWRDPIRRASLAARMADGAGAVIDGQGAVRIAQALARRIGSP